MIFKLPDSVKSYWAKLQEENVPQRFYLHFASAFLVFALGAAFAMFLVHSHPTFAALLLAALIVFAVAAPREAYDVSKGQSLRKAVFDYCSWGLGAASAAMLSWLLIRTL